MPLLGLVVIIIIQVCFLYHVFKTGRPYYWALIILMAPVLGCIVYYFVEVFPASRQARTAQRAVHSIGTILEPDRDLKARVKDVTVCGSVDNRMALAEECLRRGMAEDAVNLYRSCLEGPYAGDKDVRLGLLRALVEGQHGVEALPLARALRSEHAGFRPHEVQLLLARSLDNCGEDAEAQRVYEDLIPVHPGLEARYRYADFLLRRGHRDQSRRVFEDLLGHADLFRISAEPEQLWIKLSRQAIAGG